MFYEILFPESISSKSSISIEFNTTILKSKNGKEQRISNREEAKMVYNVVNGVKTKNDLNELAKFFRIVKGKRVGFRFKDWFDYSTKNQIIGIGTGVDKVFQLIKSYNLDINNENVVYVRNIFKPVQNKVNIFVNNVDVTNTVTINYENGKIIFNNAPSENEIITANFDFDVPVRFDNDVLEINMSSSNSGEMKEIKIIEIFL